MICFADHIFIFYFVFGQRVYSLHNGIVYLSQFQLMNFYKNTVNFSVHKVQDIVTKFVFVFCMSYDQNSDPYEASELYYEGADKTKISLMLEI